MNHINEKYYFFIKGMEQFLKNLKEQYGQYPDVLLMVSFSEVMLRNLSGSLNLRMTEETIIKDLDGFQEALYKVYERFPHSLPDAKRINNDLMTVIAEAFLAFEDMLGEDLELMEETDEKQD